MPVIEDGAGGSFKAKVNKDNRLFTKAIVDDSQHDHNHDGDAYNLNIGVVNLGTDNDTPVLYVKNNETRELIITAVAVGIDFSVNGSATKMSQITIIRNPTGGTTISNKNNGLINSNRNYASPNTLTVDFYKGADGETMTGGQDHIFIFHNDGNRLFATIEEILPGGTSMGITIKPPTGNTDMDVYAALICHLDE